MKSKSYAAPWNGRVILACKKCQKKLRKSDSLLDLAKLKKTVKRHNKLHTAQQLKLVNVGCMKLCPKNGVTICVPSVSDERLMILRDAKQLRELNEVVRDRGPKAT